MLKENIDKTIHDYYKGQEAVSDLLIESILYSVDGGGKRIRPVILLEMLEGFGLELKKAHFQVAAALEMIHTGSLIHDDLPAMDDDDYRRGRLTNHKKYSEATAVLAGDSLFLDPFDVLAQADLPAEVVVALVRLLANSAGTYGMVGGQQLDMSNEHSQPSLEVLSAIHVHKTGKLLAFPFVAAGIIAGQTPEMLVLLEELGHLVGHAFQVRDDLLDVTASFDELGKTPQKDLAAEKATYPALLGLEESYRVLDSDLDKALAIFDELAEKVGFKADKMKVLVEGLRLNG